jgi:hypothetical protein
MKTDETKRKQHGIKTQQMRPMYGGRNATVVGQYTEIGPKPNCGMNEKSNLKHEIHDYSERQKYSLKVVPRIFCLSLVNTD